MNCVCYMIPHKHWTTSRKKWTTSNERKTRTSKSLWLVQTSSSDASNPSPPKRQGQIHATTCAKQFFAKLLCQPLTLTSIWKKSSKLQPTQPLTKTDLHHWITKVSQTSNILPAFELLAKIASKRSKTTTK